MVRLTLRILPVFAVIIGFAMALAAYMNFSGVRIAYLDLIRSRMAMMAEDIGNSTMRITTREGFQMHGVVKGNLQECIARDVRVREKLVEIGTGEIDVDHVCPRLERGRRHIIEIDGRFAVANDVKRLLPDDACNHVRSRPQFRGARMQLRRGDTGTEVGQQAAVARTRHFRRHIG